MSKVSKSTVSVFLSLLIVLLSVSSYTLNAFADTHISGDYEYTVEAGKATVIKYNGSAAKLKIPASIDGYTVTGIGEDAFRDHLELEIIELPDSITELSFDAFYNTAFFNNRDNWEDGVLYLCGCLIEAKTDVSASYAVKSGTRLIADCAFLGCPSVVSVSVPEGVTVIGDRAFHCCDNMKSLTLPASLKRIGERAFGFSQSLVPADEGYKLEYVPLDGFTVYGYEKSAVQKYADDYDIPFLSIGICPDVVSTDWFYEAAEYNLNHGFITGYGNGCFGPCDALQRQDFIVILARIARADTSSYTSCELKDVNTSAYYGQAVAWAVDNEIITGYENGFFGVGDKITREQVCTVLYRYLGKPETGDGNKLDSFADSSRISGFALEAIAWAVNNEIISGKNATTLAPTAFASRAEIATVIMRMDKKGLFE